MRVQFVGCGDAFGSGGRQNTCFHVTGNSVNCLIDCGASSLPALKHCNIARNDIDLILITHFHGDHFAGLPFLLLDAQFTRRARPLVPLERSREYRRFVAAGFRRGGRRNALPRDLDAHQWAELFLSRARSSGARARS